MTSRRAVGRVHVGVRSLRDVIVCHGVILGKGRGKLGPFQLLMRQLAGFIFFFSDACSLCRSQNGLASLKVMGKVSVFVAPLGIWPEPESLCPVLTKAILIYVFNRA